MTLSTNGLIWCREDNRSGVLRAPAHPLNGVDFVEFRRVLASPPDHRFILDVTFLKPPAAVPLLDAGNFTIVGGVRVVGIKVLSVEPEPTDPLMRHVFLDQEGDFSFYLLRLDHPLIDEERCEARFSFKAGCPTEFDCRTAVACPPQVLVEPALDYLAKDYQSFRRLMTDLVAQRNPGWQERLPADLGMTLIEHFAYAGDYLSYLQDAGPGTESYLDTCLHRISAARHARLIDYRMHNGRNAFTYVHFRANAGTSGVVPAGAKLVTRIGNALRGNPSPPGTLIPPNADFDADPALVGSTVFETSALVRVTAANNELRIHTWDDGSCCLARGACEAFLFTMTGVVGGAEVAQAPDLRVGDFLLLEEVRSPVTGAEADRDPKHRHVVRLVLAEPSTDQAFTDAVPGGKLTPRLNPADPALPLLHVRWAKKDALPFTLCVSAETIEGQPIDPVAVSRGNVTPADHGRTITRDSKKNELELPAAGAARWPLPSLSLPAGPLTQQSMPTEVDYNADAIPLMGRFELDQDVREVRPAVVLKLGYASAPSEIWTPLPHLLDCGPYDQNFVAEVDNNGHTVLRFGDDDYARRPADVVSVLARFRIGNERSGNIGAETLVHLVRPNPAEPLDPANPGAPLFFADVERVYQPQVARLGADAETIEEVRQFAPEAFRAIQFRAVTEADWREVALRSADVAAAKASFHWTGSWYTVFVAINPSDPANLERLPGGGAALTPAFATTMLAWLTRFKLAGYDLVVRAATFVPLEIEIQLCVARGYFRGDVMAAVARLLSNRAYADGTRGFFHPLAFGFGEAVYLSRLYAQLDGVAGLDSATVKVFKRYWEIAGKELEHGVIPMGAFEIPRLDNDPSSPEHGVLRLIAVGGL
jgi:hypothetical protein